MQEVEKALAYDEWERVLQDGAFEESLAALRDVVAHLETGSLRLDDAVRCYEVGSLLARRCERLLDEAELRITRLDKDDEFDEPAGQLGLLND
jgi:exodeoxyribonuclease VII small subunit